MSLPNGGSGGDNHIDRRKPSSHNVGKVSKAMFAEEAEEIGNQPEWIHEGLILHQDNKTDEAARQCAACGGYVCTDCGTRYTNQVGASLIACNECGGLDIEPVRCEEIAVPGYMTCAGHGGGFKQSPAHRAARLRATITNGSSFNQILYCPCNMFKDSCNYQNMYFDDDGESRCYLEKELYDQIIEYISTSYELDGAADLIVLNRLAMAMLRLKRAEKLVAKNGEIVERRRGAPDGSIETWFEPNSAGSVVDKLDSKLLSWLKSLNVTRQARMAQQNTDNLANVNDIAALLSGDTDGEITIALPSSHDEPED